MRIFLNIILIAFVLPSFAQFGPADRPVSSSASRSRAASGALVPPPAIAVDQLGYYPDAAKFAVVTGTPIRDVFYVVSVGSKLSSWQTGVDTVFFGRLGPIRASDNSSLSTRLADFSEVHRPGIYRIIVPGYPNSYPFAIGGHVLQPVVFAALKGYYYMRSALPLDAVHAGQWSRPAGHPDTAVLVHASAADPSRPAGTVISATGGWYDAGDYNKYVVNSGITMGTLLDAWEDFPDYFDTLHTNIPAVAGVPDLLNEALYNLRWMLQMQDPADGGVYHKCTNAVFDGMVMPGVTKTSRYVVQKGTAATLDFAAVTAQAARVFGRFSGALPGLADSCRRAAIHAWQWASLHPDSVYDQNALNNRYQPAITTGAYGDRHFDDEFFWAACELLVTTGDEQYVSAVRRYIGTPLRLPSWSNVAMMGGYALQRHRANVPASLTAALDTARGELIRLADAYVRGIGGTAFHTVMGESKQDFIWGSNSVAANEGMLLIEAWQQDHQQAYLDGALSNLDYLLGRNATGYCFVTGLGSHSPMHPHHRPSIADGIVPPVPGLMAGGANPGRQDRQTYIYLEPETSYLDQDQAYASNEIAINWNAPLVYLAAGIEALQYTAGYSQPGQPTAPSQPAPPAQALQPLLHAPTKDRSGAYLSNFLISGQMSEQVILGTDGRFEYRNYSDRTIDSGAGNYRIVKDRLYLSYTHADTAGSAGLDVRLRSYARLPQMYYFNGKRLYRASDRGRMMKSAPGVSGRRMFLIFGSRRRKYYLERAAG
jgi:endoglucanase